MTRSPRQRFDQQTNIMLTKDQRARLDELAEQRALETSTDLNISATARHMLLLGMDVYEANQAKANESR